MLKEQDHRIRGRLWSLLQWQLSNSSVRVRLWSVQVSQSNTQVQVRPVSEPVGPGFWQGTGGPVTWVPWAAQGPVGTRGTRFFDLT